VAAEGDAEGGVGAGVDEPDPCPLPGAGRERPGRVADAAVDQVVGVADIAGVAASSALRAPDSTGFGPLGAADPVGDDVAPGALPVDGDADGMGMPLMLLIIGDGDAAAMDMPPIPPRRAAST
jgi:hypothetical protein